MRGGQLWGLRKTQNYAFEGVDFNPVYKDGIYQGIKASANSNMSANAAMVEEAQFFADSTMNKSGLFKYVPYLDRFAGNKILGSPIIRGLTSPYITSRGFIDRIASHGVETEGTALKGRARGDSAEDLLNFTRAEATAFNAQFRGLYYEANGMSRKNSTFNAIKDIKQVISKESQINFTDFGRAVRETIYTGINHSNAQVNEASKLTMEFVTKIGKEFTDAHGWEEGFLPPRTSINYLMQNYNLAEIRNRPEEFIGLVAHGFREQDEVIERLTRPLKDAQERLRDLQETMRGEAFMGETRSIANEIAEAKGRIKREHEALVGALESNPDHHILLEDRVLLNSTEREQLRSVLKPTNDILAETESMKKVMSKLREEKSRINQSIQKNLKESTRAKNLKKLEEIEKKLEFQDSTIKALEDKLETERLKLSEEVAEGKINRKFYSRNSDTLELQFRNPDELPKLRPVFEGHGARESEARQLRETILGNTSEHLNSQVLGGMLGGAIESPQYLKKRKVMLPSQLFNNANFLDPDIGKAVSAYSNTMGRYTALKKAFKGDQATPGIEGILKSLLQEKQKKEAGILKSADSPERRKLLAKHEKEYQAEVDYMKTVHEAFMGRTGNPKIRKVTQTLKNFAAATMLGGVPLSQITDLGAIALKQSLFPFMMQGLRPMLKSLNGTLKSAEGEAMRKNAGHAYVAIQHIGGGYQGKFLNSDMMSDIPAYGKIGSGVDTIAHVSGNLYGTNAIENLNQTMTANIFQSKVMAAAHDYLAGTATEKQLRQMAEAGIDMKQWADRFVKGYKEADGWEAYGGYQSKYYDWSDTEAAERMSRSIHRAVYNTVVQRSMFTSPLWTNDPIMGMLFTFHGWAYSAFARYTIPIMQRPDAEAAMGVAMMFGLGLLEEPLRQWANGKEVKLDDGHLFLKAVDNSGVLSAWSDMFNTVNLLMNQQLVPGLSSERRREITRWGALAGPVGGELEAGLNVLTAMWTGKITQQTVKQAARLIPGAGHLGLRRYLNDFASSTGLPERSKDAEPWPWWQSLGAQ